MLVKVRAAGLCHSDLSVIDGSRPRVMPMVLGHEAAGEVVELGPEAHGFEPGDHVSLSFVPTCGECPECRGGRAALCEPGGKANAAGTLLSGERRWARAAAPPPGRVRLRRAHRGEHPLGGEDARRPALRGGRPVRLRGADRRGRRGQLGRRAHRPERGGVRPGRRGAGGAAGGAAGGRGHAGGRGPRARTSSTWPASWAPPTPCSPATTWSSRSRRPPTASAPTTRWRRWAARRCWPRPTRPPAAAGPP